MAVQAQTDQTMVRNRDGQRSRQVWMVLLLSLVVFVALCGATGFGLSVFLSGITNTETATIKAVSRSGLAVQRHTSPATEYITGTTTLQESDRASTTDSGQAFINLFGDSGTIQMYSNSNIEMAQLRASRFFQNTKEISIILHAGTITFATGGQGDYSSSSY